MKRSEMLNQIKENPDFWDVIIIGGGATGLGAAVDAASRGYKTLLLEKQDFAKGTSSRSTKLIHGGLRYLQHGNLSLVSEALKERGLLCQNAPHLISHQAFLVPHYHWWEWPIYGIGIKIYDALAGKLGLESSKILSKNETIKEIPMIEQTDLKGGFIYYDGQFDDARLAITLAQTLADLGGTVINYMSVTNFIKKDGKIHGVVAQDLENDKIYSLFGASIINATGAFCDTLRLLDDSSCTPIINPSQGIHIILDRSFLSSSTALLIPHTKDGRVIFLVPWHEHLLVGTTDTPLDHIPSEPYPLEEEVDFLLDHVAHYLCKHPKRSDILTMFAGIRPLINSSKQTKTASLKRDHQIIVSDSNLITIAGGKWTTYRKMGEDVITKAISVASLPNRESKTEHLKLHGYLDTVHPKDFLSVYGSDLLALKELFKEDPSYQEQLDPALPFLKAEVIWAARYEMARTLEDVLARRVRLLFLNAKASLRAAPCAAELLAKELKKDKAWEKQQLQNFNHLAEKYLP